jgi:hypothetical protein
VSTDYSSIVAQYLRHQLSYDGEICEGFGVDVPYPDEEFDDYCLIYYKAENGFQYGTHLSNVRIMHPTNGEVYPVCTLLTQD